MDILRVAYSFAPEKTATIMARIYKDDSKISSLAKKLTKQILILYLPHLNFLFYILHHGEKRYKQKICTIGSLNKISRFIWKNYLNVNLHQIQNIDMHIFEIEKCIGRFFQLLKKILPIKESYNFEDFIKLFMIVFTFLCFFSQKNSSKTFYLNTKKKAK